jgi:hypothetical protein
VKPARRAQLDTRQLALDFSAVIVAESVVVEVEVAPSPPPSLVPPPPPALAPPPSLAPSPPDLRLAAQLAARVGDCRVILTQNRRTVLSSRREPAGLVVRLHRVFADAPDDVVDAVGRYLATGERRASSAISRWVDSRRGELVRHHPRPRELTPLGAVHDLADLFADVERTHFAGEAAGVGITWGKRAPQTRRRRRTIRLGTYSHEEKLIRVHPALDQHWVPRFFVRFIVFHEMLHHVEPARETDARTEFHTPRFRARERAYPEYERAITWERENLGRLLRS